MQKDDILDFLDKKFAAAQNHTHKKKKKRKKILEESKTPSAPKQSNSPLKDAILAE